MACLLLLASCGCAHGHLYGWGWCVHTRHFRRRPGVESASEPARTNHGATRQWPKVREAHVFFLLHWLVGSCLPSLSLSATPPRPPQFPNRGGTMTAATWSAVHRATGCCGGGGKCRQEAAASANAASSRSQYFNFPAADGEGAGFSIHSPTIRSRTTSAAAASEPCPDTTPKSAGVYSECWYFLTF
jgi:hypothetical protein